MFWVIFALVCFLVYFLPAVLPRKSVLRYYSCYILIFSTILTGCFFVIPIRLLMPNKVCSIVEMMGGFVSKMIGIEFEARNKRVLDGQKSAVIVLNHQTCLDLIGGIMTFKPATKYMPVLKEEFKYAFSYGLAMMLLNAAYVNGKRNKKKSTEILRKKLQDHEACLVVHPEGARNRKGLPFLPFKTGAFRVAVELKRPIIPVVISPYYFIEPGRRFTGGKIIFSFLEPIDTTNIKDDDIANFTNKVKGLMEKEYSNLKSEIMVNLEDKTKEGKKII